MALGVIVICILFPNCEGIKCKVIKISHKLQLLLLFMHFSQWQTCFHTKICCKYIMLWKLKCFVFSRFKTLEKSVFKSLTVSVLYWYLYILWCICSTEEGRKAYICMKNWVVFIFLCAWMNSVGHFLDPILRI